MGSNTKFSIQSIKNKYDDETERQNTEHTVKKVLPSIYVSMCVYCQTNEVNVNLYNAHTCNYRKQ